VVFAPGLELALIELTAARWHVTVPGGSLTVTPDLLDQELDLLTTQGVAYWEGDVSIRGKIDGAPSG